MLARSFKYLCGHCANKIVCLVSGWGNQLWWPGDIYVETRTRSRYCPIMKSGLGWWLSINRLSYLVNLSLVGMYTGHMLLALCGSEIYFLWGFWQNAHPSHSVLFAPVLFTFAKSPLYMNTKANKYLCNYLKRSCPFWRPVKGKLNWTFYLKFKEYIIDADVSFMIMQFLRHPQYQEEENSSGRCIGSHAVVISADPVT